MRTIRIAMPCKDGKHMCTADNRTNHDNYDIFYVTSISNYSAIRFLFVIDIPTVTRENISYLISTSTLILKRLNTFKLSNVTRRTNLTIHLNKNIYWPLNMSKYTS